MYIRAIAIACALAATPAMAADQFDLVCIGGGSTVRYRVDLAKGEACSDSCDRIWKMGQPTSGELKLIDRAPAYRGDLEERSTVDRSTGQWHYVLILHERPDSFDGTCELAPFSGFPVAKF